MDFEEIYKSYYKPVYFYILDLSKDANLAEEVTQEAFFKVLQKIDTFKGESDLGTWITQIAKNTFLNHCRKKKSLSIDDQQELTASTNIEHSFISKEQADEIHLILHKLSEPYKEIFWMRTFGELSFNDISKIYGKTESWARVTYYRARQMIKEGLDK